MEIANVSEFVEIIQKIDDFQKKLLEKNKIAGFISLKVFIKIVEKLLESLKSKQETLVNECMNQIIPGVDNQKLTEFLIR